MTQPVSNTYKITIQTRNDNVIECVGQLTEQEVRLLQDKIGQEINPACCGQSRCVLCELSPTILHVKHVKSDLIKISVNHDIIEELITYCEEHDQEVEQGVKVEEERSRYLYNMILGMPSTK